MAILLTGTYLGGKNLTGICILKYCFVHQMTFCLSNSKIEDSFYSNKLRLNGQTLIKKSKTVSVSLQLIPHISCIVYIDNRVLYLGESWGHFGPGDVGKPRYQHCDFNESYPEKGFG